MSLKLLTLSLCQEQLRQEMCFCLFVSGPFSYAQTLTPLLGQLCGAMSLLTGLLRERE